MVRDARHIYAEIGTTVDAARGLVVLARRTGSLATTAVAAMPVAWNAGRHPRPPLRFVYALFNISLTFFLFSFQVRVAL